MTLRLRNMSHMFPEPTGSDERRQRHWPRTQYQGQSREPGARGRSGNRRHPGWRGARVCGANRGGPGRGSFKKVGTEPVAREPVGTGGTGGVALKQDSCQPKHFFDDCSRPTPGFPVCGRSNHLLFNRLTQKSRGNLQSTVTPQAPVFLHSRQNILHTIDLREILRLL